MRFEKIRENKTCYLPLLLMADEQEDMIDLYLERGDMYVCHDPDLKCISVVTDEGGGIIELKNIAVMPASRRMGYGRAMLAFLESRYKDSYYILQAGTGDVPSTTIFYESCGFVRSHSLPGFFTMNYRKPIYEDGILLKDMIYFRKRLRE